jgi:SWI/SNF-related matrix-associated actin-dependent regulator 1 of chromatin subfamily A
MPSAFAKEYKRLRNMRKKLTHADSVWVSAMTLKLLLWDRIYNMLRKLAAILRLKKRRIRREVKLPEGCSIKPKEFQLEGVGLIDHYNGRALLGDEMGLGKTVQAGMYMMLRDFKQVVIVCFATLKYNWERELAKLGIQADVLEGETPFKPGMIRPSRVVIINYDVLWAWTDYLRGLGPELVIGDEIQAIKSANTRRCKSFRELCKGVRHVLALSGTPIENGVMEFFPVLNLLWPKEFPAPLPFALMFCPPERDKFGGVKYGPGVQLKLLNHRLKRLGFIRRLKKDVMSELPKKTRTVVPLKLSDRDMQTYRAAMQEFRSWARDNKKSRDFRKEGFQQISHMLRLTAKLKLPQVIQWVEDFLESGNKLIGFALNTNKPPVLKSLAEHFGNRAVVVDGNVSPKDRMNRVDRFNSDDECRLFLGQLRAACAGWSCTSASSTAHFQLWWQPMPHIQGEDRPHGIGRGMGKDVPCNAYYLVAKDTVEERVAMMLQRKAEEVDMCLDGRNDVTNMNLYTMLLDEMAGEVR